MVQVWFSNRRARLRKQLSSTTSNYATLGVVGGPYGPASTPYGSSMTSSINDGSFNSAAAGTSQSRYYQFSKIKHLSLNIYL